MSLTNVRINVLRYTGTSFDPNYTINIPVLNEHKERKIIDGGENIEVDGGVRKQQEKSENKLKDNTNYYKEILKELIPFEISSSLIIKKGGRGRKIVGGEEIEIDLSDLYGDQKKEVTKKSSKDIRNDIMIFSEDTIEILKEKIFLLTDIVPFKQYLYWMDPETKKYKTSYDIIKQDTGIYVNTDIRGILSYEKISGIPVQLEQEHTFSYTIEGNDKYYKINRLFDRYGINEYFVISLDEILNLGGEITSVIKKEDSEMTMNNYDQSQGLQSLKELEPYIIDNMYVSTVLPFFPKLTKETFISYIDGSISSAYPLLNPTNFRLNRKYSNQKDILTQYAKIKETELRTIKFNMGIIETRVTVNFIRPIKLRELLEEIHVEQPINYIHSILKIKKKYLSILKRNIKYSPFVNDITFLKISEDNILLNIDMKNGIKINVVFYKNGYKILSEWREDLLLDFKDVKREIKRIINPIIERINKKDVIPEVNFYTAIINRINTNIFWKKMISNSSFDKLITNIEKLQEAGMIRRNKDSNNLEYFITYGVDYDPLPFMKLVDNSYLYDIDEIALHQFDQLYTRKKLFRVIHRSSDVKFEIVGLSESEFEYFVKNLFSTIYISKLEDRKDVKEIKKKITKLKQEDPILYNAKLYKNYVYSKSCQEPFQPTIYTESEYKLLNANQKDRTTKYWNFTTRNPVYYECSEKYPHLRFLTGLHPKEGKIRDLRVYFGVDQLEKNDRRLEVHSECLNKYEIQQLNSADSTKEKSTTVTSAYIVNYGKDLEPGRLSHLPEESIESLLYDIFGVLDSGCVLTKSYFLYGTHQYSKSGNNMSVAYSIAEALNIDVKEFMLSFKNIIHCVFNTLLNGTISDYFSSPDDLLNNLLESNKVFRNTNIYNEIIINLCKYKNFNVIIFRDMNINDASGKSVILELPENLVSINEFLPLDITKYILLIRKNENTYYPIVNITNLKKKQEIIKFIFDMEDSIMKMIYSMVKFHIENSSRNEFTENNINLDMLVNYDIKELFININNLCYGCMLNDEENLVYLPLKTNYRITHKLSFEPFDPNNYTLKLSKLVNMLVKLNKKSDLSKSQYQINNFFQYQQRNYKIMGFIYNNNTFYYTVEDISKKEVYRLLNNKDEIIIKHLDYDPIDINKQIYENKVPVSDNRTENIKQNQYNNNLYKLIILHFIDLWSKEKNKSIRDKIVSVISKSKGNFSELNTIKSSISIDDKRQLDFIINSYMTHGNKHQFINDLNNLQFDFDRISLNKLLEKDDIYDGLQKMSKNFVEIVSNINTIKDFPNILKTCNNNKKSDKDELTYCKDKKIKITKNKLDRILRVLAYNLKNDITKKYLTSYIYINSVINSFEFSKNIEEEILIL